MSQEQRRQGLVTGKYLAITWWDGQQWLVYVQDYDQVHQGDTTAQRLAQVAPNASYGLATRFGCEPNLVPVAVEVRLPEQIEYTLQIAEGHVADASREVESAVTALRQANVSGHDVATVLAARTLQAVPRQALLIPNTEIAARGLSRWHDVTAVEWEDHDVTLTCCRGCVEKDLRPWQQRRDGTSAAIYDGPGHCDICGRDMATPAHTPVRRKKGRDDARG